MNKVVDRTQKRDPVRRRAWPRIGLALAIAPILLGTWFAAPLLLPASDANNSARAQSTVGEEGRSIRLETEPLAIVTGTGRHEFTAEIADEPHERSTGLMFREEMAADHGMLFVFDQTRKIQMWMKNTPLSLDMVFIRPDGTVARIARATEPYSLATISSGEPVSHVLELRAGVSKLISLKPGDRVEHRSIGGANTQRE